MAGFLCGGAGYFFFVTLITPKITTANRLSKVSTSNTVMLSPPFLKEVEPFPSRLTLSYTFPLEM